MVDLFKMKKITGVVSYYIKTPNTMRMDRFRILTNLNTKMEVVDYKQLKSMAIILPVKSTDSLIGSYIQKHQLITTIQNNGWVVYYKYDVVKLDVAPMVKKYQFDTTFKMYPTQPKFITTFTDQNDQEVVIMAFTVPSPDDLTCIVSCQLDIFTMSHPADPTTTPGVILDKMRTPLKMNLIAIVPLNQTD